MLCPHARFIAYLIHKERDNISDYVPQGLPIPDTSNVKELGFKKIGRTKAWAKKNNLVDIELKANTIYNIWHNVNSRNLMVLHAIRKPQDNIKDLLWDIGKWKVSDKEIELYYDLFWNTKSWESFDYYDYLSKLRYEDHEYFKDILSDLPTEVVLKKLGVTRSPVSTANVLDRLLMKGYQKFESEEDSLKWGNFILKVIKEMKNVETVDPEKILRDLKAELGDPEVEHPFPPGDII